ncbi:MAG: SHOCT domain-containing protein [Methylococcaceae bacterium]
MNQPLSPIEQAKVFFFWVGLILLIGAGGAGILLILVTSWGLYRMRSTHDFSYLDTVFIIHKWFAALASLGLLVLVTIWYKAEVIVFALMIYPVYSFLLNTLFYAPLSKHKEWVVANGMFSTSPVEAKEPRTVPFISFGNPSSLALADELLKLNNLKDSNLLSEEEFSILRKRLLK